MKTFRLAMFGLGLGITLCLGGCAERPGQKKDDKKADDEKAGDEKKALKKAEGKE